MSFFHEPRATGCSRPLHEVRIFLEEHRDAVVNACLLLGGNAAGGRALELICAVAGATDLPRWVKRDLSNVYRLLSAQE